MALYVDGYVLPVPKSKLKVYKRMAQLGARIWKKHGALEYRECIGDDLASKWGTPFPKQLKAKRGETIVFSWIVFKSRAHRDSVNGKVMNDPALAKMMKDMPMPFEMKRMLYGGFKVLVEF